MVEQVMHCRVGSIALSNHASVEMNINLNTEAKGRGTWRMNITMPQDEMFSDFLVKDLKLFFELNI